MALCKNEKKERNGIDIIRVVNAFDAIVVVDTAGCVTQPVADSVNVERLKLVSSVFLKLVQRSAIQSV